LAGVSLPLYAIPDDSTQLLTDLDVDNAQESHQEVYGQGGYDNQAKFSHELIGGAAAFEGMKLFEDHQRSEGKLTTMSASTCSSHWHQSRQARLPPIR